MGSMIEAINRRVSVRTYADKPLQEDLKQKVKDLVHGQKTGPFGQAVKLVLIDLSEEEKREIRNLGTYGVIRGASLYVAGVVDNTRGAMIDLGYCLEKVILEITSLGLGTCWMGGTFNRAGFARKTGASKDQVVPAVTPVGYAANRRSALDAVFRGMAGSDNRKPWPQLFFEGDRRTPLTKEAAGAYDTALACLRLAPSASNRQPWRVIKEPHATVFHFFVQRTPGYGRFTRADLQLVDMGIGMCHFQLAAAETGLAGGWVTKDLNADAWEYLITWTGA